MATIELLQSNIVDLDVDAIVNAANQTLLGGGGVDGAIHRAAGPELLEACRKLPELRPRVRCPTGEARITRGFKLRARHVIHTVGPVYGGQARDDELLSAAHRASLALAAEHELRSVAFPAISCGAYRFPPNRAAAIALGAVGAWDARLPEQVMFTLFSTELYQVWRDVLHAS